MHTHTYRRDLLAAGRYVNDNATVGKTKKKENTTKGATAAMAATAAPQDAVVLMASPLHSSCEYKYPYSHIPFHSATNELHNGYFRFFWCAYFYEVLT